VTSPSFEDGTREVRAGEELDREKLAGYLGAQLGPGAITIEQFPGGHSNLTYLVQHGDAEYVLRRPPFGAKIKTAHDMGREFRVLSHLAPVYPKAPRPVLFCEDEDVIGAKFYLMERRRGVILRKDLPAGMTLAPETARRLCELLVDALVELHHIDYVAAGLGDLGKPAGYVERQVKGWTERYTGSQTDDIAEVTRVAAWLDAHRPADGAPALIHNDFKFDNLLLTPNLDAITGVLDWEMSTVGDARMDLGTSLSYWVEAGDPPPMHMMRFGLTMLPGMMTRAEVIARYAERSGVDLGDAVFYYAYGLFKTAVVAQQIYYRYAKGLTQDARFAVFIHGVRALAEQAQRAIDAGRI
jgi:aminoglycoside phosphotransferase (APT) family kinase protein